MRDVAVMPQATEEQTAASLAKAREIQKQCASLHPEGCLDRCALKTLILNGGKRWDTNNPPKGA
jgi:hypothetical protein